MGTFSLFLIEADRASLLFVNVDDSGADAARRYRQIMIAAHADEVAVLADELRTRPGASVILLIDTTDSLGSCFKGHYKLKSEVEVFSLDQDEVVEWLLGNPECERIASLLIAPANDVVAVLVIAGESAGVEWFAL